MKPIDRFNYTVACVVASLFFLKYGSNPFFQYFLSVVWMLEALSTIFTGTTTWSNENNKK